VIFTELALSGAFLIQMQPHFDQRGFFARSFCQETFAGRGLADVFVQMNTSFSQRRGTLRGLHFQRPPAAETKMVRCVAGAIFDAILDLRAGSQTFGQVCTVELSATNRHMLYIPRGVAHGFQTLCDEVELLYWHDTAYAPGYEGGVNALDPTLGIDWPLPPVEMSPRDVALPPLRDLESLLL